VTPDGQDQVRAHYRHQTPFYDLVVSTSPARIHSLRVDPAGQGRYTGVVSNFGPKGSAPFASYGSRLKWHEDRSYEAGRPVAVTQSPDSLRLERIPVGPHGLAVTWEFQFDRESFRTGFRWIAEREQHGLWEAGWKLDGIARHIGDAATPDAAPGFGGSYRDREAAFFTWWEDDPRYRHTLACAYLPGSADRGDATYREASEDRPVTWGAWLAISQPGGISLAAGSSFSAGQWRIGSSATAADRRYAATLGAAAGAVPDEAVPDQPALGEPRVPGTIAGQPDQGEPDSDLVAARTWGAALGQPGPAGPRTGRGPDGSWVLTDGAVLAAFVPVAEGGFVGRCYVRAGDTWQLALGSGPGQRYLAVSPDETGDGLLVGGERTGPDGAPVSRSSERWSLRADPPRIHVDSVDSLAPGSTVYAPHAYLAYPAGRSKFELGDGFDTLIGPHLRPMADLVMGQHAMRSPAIGVQHGAAFAALVPDLQAHRRPGGFGHEESPRHFGLFLDLDIADRRCDGALLRFGWTTMEWTFSLWRVEEGYFCRQLAEPAPRPEVPLAYDLLLDGAAPFQGVLASTQRLLWSAVGHRYFAQSALPQTQPADRAFDDAWSWGEQLYEERTVDGTRLGAVRVDREFPPDAMFTTWFNSLRTSYGLASNGRDRGDEELAERGRATLALLLSAPHEHGAFPTIARFGPDRIEWFGGHKNFANQMPWGPASYNTFDMSWTAYWLLRWHQDLGPEPAALDFARRYGDFLLRFQLPSGAIPSWLSMADLTVDPHLRESAQTAASLLFLAELAFVTGERKYAGAATRAGRYVAEQHVDRQRWDDFEVYYSNAPKSEGAYDPLSGMSAQDTLSMHLAAAGFAALARAAADDSWLGPGGRALDQLLQYQAVWPASFLSLYTFGGFSVQNTDQEWNDARQAQIAPTLLDYARATGRSDYAERGIAALRASYATMCTPTAEAINPRYFDYQPRGWANENYAHNPYDAPTTPVPTPHFDWGVGPALAAFAEARNRFGDVWVDLAAGTAYGIDEVAVTRFHAADGRVELDLEARTDGHHVLLKVDGADPAGARLRVNGADYGLIGPGELVAGLRVPTRFRGRIVHNNCRVDPPRPGADLRLTAYLTDGTVLFEPVLRYRTAQSTWRDVPVTASGDGQLAATIPGADVSAGTWLEYYFCGQTPAGPVCAPEVDPQQVPYAVIPG
jgi:hypothetical protein